MTVKEIIEAVRYCYDEQAFDGADFNNASANDNIYMDNIIKAKIGDALRWVCLYAPADFLYGTDEPDTEDTSVEPPGTTSHPTGILVDVTETPTPIPSLNPTHGVLTTSEDFIRLVRVRVPGWHRAVKVPLSEDSEEYLQLYDPNGATATADRPQAALIEKAQRQIEVWPWTTGTVDYTYVASVDPEEHAFDVTSGEPAVTERHYPLPPKAKSAFIYYLAFLLLSAYADARAPRMLEIAKMNLGKTREEQE